MTALQDVIRDYPDRFADCRIGNHRWKRQGDPSREPGGTYVIRWRCPGCGGQRFYRVTSSGTVYARWYRMPDGWGIRGHGHATRRKAPWLRDLIERTDT